MAWDCMGLHGAGYAKANQRDRGRLLCSHYVLIDAIIGHNARILTGLSYITPENYYKKDVMSEIIIGQQC